MRKVSLLAAGLVLLSLPLLMGQGCPGPTLPPDSTGDGDSSGGGDGSATAAQTLAYFDELWSTFDRKYSYFTYKDVDWNDVRSLYRPGFDQGLTPEAFAEQVGEMLQELHDWHTWVQAPNGPAIGYDGTVVTNFPPTLLAGYAKNGAYTTLGNNVIFHALVGRNVAHIVIDTFDTAKFSSVSDADIENLFVTYAGANGMIIDIRNNNGGNETIAAKFASRFTDQARVYGYTATRNGPGHDDFDPLQTKTLQPSAGTHFTKPAVCLIGQRCMSSAEWFTLMMKACPNVTLIGDSTRGASGNPEEFTLANGVTYAVSRWVAYTADMTPFEDVGIAPDLQIAPESSYTDSDDFVLEIAITQIAAQCNCDA